LSKIKTKKKELMGVLKRKKHIFKNSPTAIIGSCSASAFAPASIGNVAVGFDVLGLSVPSLGDIVTVKKIGISNQTSTFKQYPIYIESISGVVTDLPRDYRLNTATAAIAALIKPLKLKFSLSVSIKKNIPLGSGLGGSAASAVAGVVAANALLGHPYSKKELFSFALEGERIASGAAHPDNVAPSLFGGLVMASSQFSEPVQSIPLPKGLYGVVVHPDIEVKTKQARKILKKKISLEAYVQQSALLAGFTLACSQNKLLLLKDTLKDLIIEPQRSHFIPEFASIKKQVLADKNSLGFSISGSGPSVFTLVVGKTNAVALAQLIKKNFSKEKINSQAYVFSLSSEGAYSF
jgi:homoserine kinase